MIVNTEKMEELNTRRKILNRVVCTLLVEAGYDNADKQCVEVLTEMLQSFIVEIGQSSRNYCELAGRTEVLIADLILALVNAGIRTDDINTYANRPNRSILPQLQQQTQTKQLNILQAGVKQNHPPHIPSHLPSLPDPHAYIRTPTHKQPVTEYEAIREKVANQKRDIERALTRFVAKTGETHSLFLTEDNSMFPLIACKPQHPSYLTALLPTDQVFDQETEEQFEPKPVKRKKPEKKEVEEEIKAKIDPVDQNEETTTQQDTIDNPYLRPVQIPKNIVTES
ncbi:transcription initiation factor TFIID subunit 8-like [Leptopilina boulardi]|uniref:transcription initiation factor TFIID subunit 8-like n=1 Tax=Leptopilina boulardi TaxID=63433 RepID=UPI0021F69B7E|nr:transcription initiation factor TFIID subunit 8-like [Leptopilina boulardi]